MSTQEERDAHPEVVEMENDLKKINSIEVVSRTEGGKLLQASLVTDVVGLVDTLCVKFSTLTHAEFISICAEMKSKIDIARVMKRSKKNKDDLEAMIAETLSQ